MRIERTVIALGLSALLYAQAPGVFDTLEADGDARFNGDVVFTTPSGALVSFQSLVNAGVGLPMTIDSDTSTPGYQCPSGMEEVTEARGRMPLGVTPSGTLGGETGDEYTDTDIARRGGTAQSISGSASTSVGSHTHDEWGVGGSVGVIGGNTGIFAQQFGEGTTGATTPSASTSVSVTDYTDKPHPAPALQVLWCRFS